MKENQKECRKHRLKGKKKSNIINFVSRGLDVMDVLFLICGSGVCVRGWEHMMVGIIWVGNRINIIGGTSTHLTTRGYWLVMRGHEILRKTANAASFAPPKIRMQLF